MAWYDEARFYHIYPLGLLDAPKENKYEEPVHRFKELSNWIDLIADNGFNAIYIGPLFESVGHGYETTDYKKLDSRLGDNEDLIKFVKECHDRNLKVIFDGVFNHVGRDFFAFKDLLKNRENSQYKDWFLNVNFWGNNEYNDGFSYDNWGGYNLLVKLNQRNPAVRDYITDCIRFWVKEFDVDGIRLDAADVLDFDYMKALRGIANEVKPDFWLMGEVIHGDYTRWVNEGTLHSVTNYSLHKALYSGHNDHNYFEIAHTVKRLYEMGGNRPDGLKLYNFVDNHDVERIITKLNNKAHYTPVHILLYTLPGVPSVYYGSEFGIEGKKEKFSDASLRPTLKYEDFKDAKESNACTKLIARLNSIRADAKVLSYGDYRQVALTNRQYLFTRSFNGVTAIIAVNNDDCEATVYGNGIQDGNYVGALSGQKYTVSGGNIAINLAANSGDILLMENDDSVSFEAFENVVTETVKIDVKSENKPEIKVEVLEVVKEEIVDTVDTISSANETFKEAKIKLDNSAADKYGLSDEYSDINPDLIRTRNDYESMSLKELQVAILEKMAKNGPVNDQMIKTVMDNVYPDSLKNWVRSFN